MLSGSNSQTNININIQLPLPGTVIRKRIVYGTICVIIILLIYMESNLLSMDPQHTNDEDAMSLFIGSEQSKAIPIQSILQQNVAKTDNTNNDNNINEESDDITNSNANLKLKLNQTDWDRETKWFHQIEFQESVFNVTWHTLFDNETDLKINENRHKIESEYNLHPLHPNFDTIELLPLPRKFLLYSKLIPIGDKQLKFESNMPHSKIIENSINKYLPLMFEHRLDDIDVAALHEYYFLNVEIRIKNTDISIFKQDTDESYRMLIPFGVDSASHTISISCMTVFGVLHAMETLSQLIEYDFNQNLYFIKYIGYISDSPFYKYRGVHLDTSRHFYPIGAIFKLIDSMVYTKFNVFHWHIVDDQSWPFPLSVYPNVSMNSSWSKYEQYSLSDVYAIISYAALHGIRVIPEFDVPAHVASLCEVFDICMDQFCTRSTNGLLDPTKSQSLTVIFNIYREIMSIFADEYVHIGHDEADYKKCFRRNGKLKSWVSQNVIRGKKRSRKELGVYYYFLDKTHSFFKQEYQNKRIIAWDDIWFRLRKKFDIPSDIILVFWRQAWKQKIWEMIAMNFSIIMSEPFYIDLTNTDLKRRYYWDLWMVEKDRKSKNGLDAFDEKWRDNILGGQACIWSERIDISVLDAKLFPDLSAIAENLWLGGKYTKYNNWNIVKKRLKWHRCLLLKRGIGASPIESNRSTNLYNRQPPQPGSCYQQ